VVRCGPVRGPFYLPMVMARASDAVVETGRPGHPCLGRRLPHRSQRFPEHAEEGLEPHRVKELYLWTSNEANLSVDTTDVVDP